MVFQLGPANPVAVEVARLWFHLPYFHGLHEFEIRAGRILVYSSRRSESPRWRGNIAKASYNAAGVCQFEASAEHWNIILTERYCLYAQNWLRTIARRDIDHDAVGKLQEARATLMANTMLEKWRIADDLGPPVGTALCKIAGS